MSNLSNADVYAEVTETILAKLREGVVPWAKPFGDGAGSPWMPRNFNSNRPYRGINVFLLSMRGFGSPHWMTFKGAQRAGGQVRKGEKSTQVILWKPVHKKTGERDADGRPITSTIMLLRTYRVFNAEQVDGLDITQVGDAPEADPFAPIAAAQEIVDGFADGPTVQHSDGVGAWYMPMADLVNLPTPDAFVSRESYYATAFHELVHSTGHKDRLARPGVVGETGQLDRIKVYSQEELVAELGSAMLCGLAGIGTAVIDNQAAYVGSWLRALEDDPRMVVMAGAQAQKAADRILGVSFGEAS